ncbi:hypothetical protein BDV96DRAFT_646722 [Lophiotrema nucula]|uniref:Fungal N-terminal domain-containing protein n=1 Tax=Lophiotrema nucula TaxID=690887 RepID=A0A6A5Z723_9PLEO|nr:hypothetical protein BDV96DRAFT_646722 [Lophiotrema nucula]
MDPISIVAGVAGVIFTCLKITKALNSIRPDYLEASATIAAICSESSLVSASLSQIQALLLQKTGTISEYLENRPDLAATLDTALTGCTVVFACLEEEVARLRPETCRDEDERSLAQRVKTFWKAGAMKELLESVRGQQGAITLLIQILQMESLSEIQRTVEDNTALLQSVVQRTHSLRSLNPHITSRVPRSILARSGSESMHYVDDASTVGATEFEFDDELVNAQVYRRALEGPQDKRSTLQAREPGISPTSPDLIYQREVQADHELEQCEELLRADSLFSFDEAPDNFWSTSPDLKLEDRFCQFQLPDVLTYKGDSASSQSSTAPEQEIPLLPFQTEPQVVRVPLVTLLAEDLAPANGSHKTETAYIPDDLYSVPSEPSVVEDNFNLHLIAEHNRLVEADMGPKLQPQILQQEFAPEEIVLSPQYTTVPLIQYVPSKSVATLPSAMKRKSTGPQRFLKVMNYKKKKTVSFQLPEDERAAIEERLQFERRMLEERRMSWERRRRRRSIPLGLSVRGEKNLDEF